MGILKNMNALRRALMRRLTKDVGNSYAGQIPASGKIVINRILICRPNRRLGNQLMITPLLQDITATFPGCKIDLFVQGNLAPAIFKNYKNVENIIQLPVKPLKQFIKYAGSWMAIKKNHYDLVINVVENSSSGRLSTRFANAEYKFFGNMDEEEQLKYNDSKHMAKSPVYALRSYLQAMGFAKNDREILPLNLKLSAEEIAEGKKILHEIVKNEKKTISLFTYATGDKCYPESWWENLYDRLKKEYPDFNIIEILPIQKVSKISFKAPTYFDKDIRKVGSLIANAQVFIGADGGVMHLASAVNTPVIGLFSVTDQNQYRPYNEKSIAITTNKNGPSDDDISECMQALNKILQ
jgi:ADP-heptose:LPS heptosyltransferase